MWKRMKLDRRKQEYKDRGSKRMIKLATVFSGIGAVEHALDRLKLPYEIVFACDNGEIDL